MSEENLTLATSTYPEKQEARVEKYKFGANFSRHAIGPPAVAHLALSPTPIGYSY